VQRKDIRDLILKGQQDIVVEIYRKQGIEFTKEASLSLLLGQTQVQWKFTESFRRGFYILHLQIIN
jgi:hypothetical protein